VNDDPCSTFDCPNPTAYTMFPDHHREPELGIGLCADCRERVGQNRAINQSIYRAAWLHVTGSFVGR
jgi:hypothetical protein